MRELAENKLNTKEADFNQMESKIKVKKEIERLAAFPSEDKHFLLDKNAIVIKSEKNKQKVKKEKLNASEISKISVLLEEDLTQNLSNKAKKKKKKRKMSNTLEAVTGEQTENRDLEDSSLSGAQSATPKKRKNKKKKKDSLDESAKALTGDAKRHRSQSGYDPPPGIVHESLLPQ